MIFSFLTPENIGKKYLAAKDYTKALTDNFEEYERIARNRPHNNIPDEYPRTTDGTTASIIRKTPKRVVQQIPTGKIESDDDTSWLPIVAEFVYTNKILPYANDQYDLVQKSWNTIERGLTFGSSATYTPFLDHDGHFSTDMNLIYWGDVFIQPGKKSGYSCDYIFIRSWWQEEDVDALIDKEKKLRKENKDYESTWDLEQLEAVKKSIVAKDQQAVTPDEDERNYTAEGIEIVTGFQRGVGATFYTFNPAGGDEKNGTTRVLRKKKNKDPRGKMPIDWFYADIDGTNPLGRGVIDLVGGLQNLIDSDMQSYQYNRALMLAPPLVKTGSFSKRKIMYKPNAIIDLGNDPNASIKPLDVDTTAVQNYPELYGLQKSQLLNLVSSPDTSISAEVGNPGFSKTDSGVKAQQANVSVDDNYVRKMFEAWFENWSETAINLFFAERQGVEILDLDKKTADSLRKLAQEGKFDESLINENNQLIIDYDQATPALTFRVDASTSKMKDDTAQGEILTSLIKGLDGSQVLSSVVPTEKILELWNRLVSNSGVEDPEDMSIDVQEFMKQQQMAQEQQMQQQQMMAQQGGLPAQAGQAIDPAQIPEAEVIDQQMPPMQEPMPVEQPPSVLDGVSPDNPLAQIYQSLIEQGYPEDLASDAVDMAASGATPDEVMSALQEVVSYGG